MSFLENMFGKNKNSKQKTMNYASKEIIKEIESNTDKLWKLLEESIKYYDTISCQCSFPRFYQYTSIDCSDTNNSFYMSETEGLIHFSKKNFQIQEIEKGQECYKAKYTCLKCSSIFECGWSDFSIHVNRTYLKPIEIKAEQKGANPIFPIPFFVGLFGHSYPDRNLFKQVDFDIFKNYLLESKNGA